MLVVTCFQHLAYIQLLVNLLQLAGHQVAVDPVLVTESHRREQERGCAVEDDGCVSDIKILKQVIQTLHCPEITGN